MSLIIPAAVEFVIFVTLESDRGDFTLTLFSVFFCTVLRVDISVIDGSIG